MFKGYAYSAASVDKSYRQDATSSVSGAHGAIIYALAGMSLYSVSRVLEIMETHKHYNNEIDVAGIWNSRIQCFSVQHAPSSAEIPKRMYWYWHYHCHAEILGCFPTWRRCGRKGLKMWWKSTSVKGYVQDFDVGGDGPRSQGQKPISGEGGPEGV